MSPLKNLLGEKLLGKSGEVTTESVETKVLGIYFSASWCPPCHQFTPMLVKWYENLQKNGKDIEIVFVSMDKDESSFEAYFDKMPWLALPFDAKDIAGKLSSKMKVRGIPTFVLVDGQSGEVYEPNAREIVMSDAEGKDYPWVPPSIEEALGEKFVRNDGTAVGKEALEGKYVALYFSASWCPPCRGFTSPILKPCYNKLVAEGKNFEVIYISSDRSQSDFDTYFGEMPWLALPFEDRERKNMLSRTFEVSGIPTLILLDPDFNVVNKALRAAVTQDPEGEEFPWLPKPVQSLEEGAEDINDVPALVVLMEEENSTTQAQFEAILSEIADEHKAKVKTGERNECLFLVAKSEGGIAGQIRKLCKLEDAAEGTRTLCNGDMCLKLNNSTAVVLLDIPDNGGFYTLDGELTKENICGFFEDFVSDGLKEKRKQLG